MNKKIKNAKGGHFLKVPKWRLKLVKNALKCVRQASTVQKTTVQDAGRGAVFACVTHFSAFLANFKRHFGTLKLVISPQILYSRIQLDYLYRHAKYQVCSVSKKGLIFCLKIGFKFAWPFISSEL